MEEIFNIPKAEQSQINYERKKAQNIKKSNWWKVQLAKNKCHYCKKRFHPSELTMDHKISLMRGGKSTKKNLVPACEGCNKKKKHFFFGEINNEKKIL